MKGIVVNTPMMIGTGLRIGEVTDLRWCDIDLEEGFIDVNHTLVYYDHRTPVLLHTLAATLCVIHSQHGCVKLG